MGRWLDWTLEADLTTEEIGRIKKTCDKVLVPALIRISDRKREPAGLFARLVHMAQEEKSYARSAVFAFREDSISVAQCYPPTPLIVRFKRGASTGKTLGFADVAVFGLLAVIADETGKLRLLPSVDVEADGVVEALTLIEGVSEYRFKDITGFASVLGQHEEE